MPFIPRTELERRLRIAFGRILSGHTGQHADFTVECGQSLYVVGVVHVNIVRELLDKAIRSRYGRIRFVLSVVGIRHLQHGLLRIASVRVARLQCLVLLDRIGKIAVIQFSLRLMIKLVCGQVFGRV